jgi:GGDEF domain-containing protein
MLTERLLSFADRLDATHQIAYLDPVTQLPNSIAAEREMKRALQLSQRNNDVFSILFIDGDNLRFYNDISYSAGDEMLRQLAQLLLQHLRPGDFIARWRVGDEFWSSACDYKGAFMLQNDSDQKWKQHQTVDDSHHDFDGISTTRRTGRPSGCYAVEKAAKYSKSTERSDHHFRWPPRQRNYKYLSINTACGLNA